jgi:hypothetical protein
MNAHNLIIGGVVIALESSHGLTQTYESIGGRSLRRMLNGNALLQTQWAKQRTIIKGRGRLPPGLDGLDYTSSLTLSCAAPLSIWSATTSATLPAARRSDFPPRGFAIVNGRQISTPISIATNTVTFTPVSGATGYVVIYYPTMIVYAEPPSQTFDAREIDFDWTIEAEAV